MRRDHHHLWIKSITVGLIGQFILGPLAPSFAQTAPTSKATVISEVQKTQGQTLSNYFPSVVNGRPPAASAENWSAPEADKKRFNSEFRRFVSNLDRMGYFHNAKDRDEFLKWYEGRSEAFLTQSQIRAWKDVTLEQYLTIVYLRYLGERFQHDKDENGFIARLLAPLQNPAIVGTLTVSIGLIWGVVKWVGPILQGSIISGPLASVVSSFLDPIFRPIREWSGKTGARLFRKISLKLQNMLAQADNAKSVGMASKEKLKDLDPKSFFAGMGPDEVKNNLNALTTEYTSILQVWNETYPPYLRDGRGLRTEALFIWNRNYAQAITIFKGDFLQARGRREAARAKLETAGLRDLEKVQDLYLQWVRPTSEQRKGQTPESRQKLEQQINEMKVALLADHAQEGPALDEYLRASAEAVNAQHEMAGVLVEWILRSFEYPEYGRANAGVQNNPLFKNAEEMRVEMGLYFHLAEGAEDIRRFADSIFRFLNVVIDLGLIELERFEKDVTGSLRAAVVETNAFDPRATPQGERQASNSLSGLEKTQVVDCMQEETERMAGTNKPNF